MPIIRHDNKDMAILERLIVKEDGTPLQGEIDMYRRIYEDCNKSELTWHFWHSLRLPIPVKRQSEIEIDFFLVCEKGAFVVEVKGGGIILRDGQFAYLQSNEYMSRSPFEQASDYCFALTNNRIINRRDLFVTSICAFPHTKMAKTNDLPNLDLGYKLWSAIQHGDPNVSFADFCIKVLEEDKQKKHWFSDDLSHEELATVVRPFSQTINGGYDYSEESLRNIATWLQVQDLELFKCIERNDRLLIEGGPGTGKTTFAKAFVNRYRNASKGLYLCWNKLLKTKIKKLFEDAKLNCEVEQYISFFNRLDPDHKHIDYNDFADLQSLEEKIKALLFEYRERPDFIPYDYIVVDEAQDIFDKNVTTVLDYLTSAKCDGIKNGRYLVFYDTEQGYMSEYRNLEGFADNLIRFCSHFKLSENKRVPTNIELVEYAKKVLNSSSDTLSGILSEIEIKNSLALRIKYFSGAREVIKYINASIRKIQDEGHDICDYVLLADSHSKKKACDTDESLFDRLSDIEKIKLLTEDNVCYHENLLQFTSILAYKGLEQKHVILLLSSKENIDKFELYIGMSRAIFDLELLIID